MTLEDLELQRQVVSAAMNGIPPVAQTEEKKEEEKKTPATTTPSAPATATEPATVSFADLLAENAAFRKQQSENWEKREREGRSRKTMAAISDALASLGNLVGTSFGAVNQQQTYQMPFVVQDIEQDRAMARATADRLRNYDMSIRQMDAETVAAGSEIAGKMALEKLRQQGRSELQSQKTADSAYLEALKQGGRIDLKQMDIDYKKDRDKMANALKQQGINISRERLDEMIRHNQAIEVIRENSAGGRVGGYKTVITRDEFGREISRERIPTTNQAAGGADNAPYLPATGDNAPYLK